MDNKALFKLSYGLFVLTARQDGKLDEIGSDVKTIKDLLIGKALKK